jgi:hypothetical protein
VRTVGQPLAVQANFPALRPQQSEQGALPRVDAKQGDEFAGDKGKVENQPMARSFSSFRHPCMLP